jgi:hypothetical protein
MADKPNRITADLKQYPDLVVVYVGMRVRTPRGLKTLLSFGPKIQASLNARPDGLLLHEYLVFSVLPPHPGLRQYWRDFDSLERWARTFPHKQWWQDFLHDTGGTGFWHEAYLRGGTWSRSSSTCLPSVSHGSGLPCRLAAPCSPHAAASAALRNRSSLRRCRRTRSTGRCDRSAMRDEPG